MNQQINYRSPILVCTLLKIKKVLNTSDSNEINSLYNVSDPVIYCIFNFKNATVYEDTHKETFFFFFASYQQTQFPNLQEFGPLNIAHSNVFCFVLMLSADSHLTV